MVRRTQVVVGGPRSIEWLKKEIVKKEISVSWSCGKHTKENEFLFIYAMKPDCAIVAAAIASSDARPNKKWHFVANIKNVRILERPISRKEMLKEIPEWGWPKQPRRATYPKEDIVRKLLKLTDLKGKRCIESTITISSTGAGFGTAEQKREAEEAACKAVRTHFERKGYEVVSREKEKIGYDFDAQRKEEMIHIEAKGISGSYLQFPITANEIACARSDTKFRMAIVTDVKSPQKKVRVISREDFLKHFHFRPFAFFAEPKSSLFA